MIRRQSIADRAGCSDDPARQYAAVGAPVFGIENSLHIIMRMTGEDVNALVSFVLGLKQIDVNAAAALGGDPKLVHAVIFGDALGQSFVHSDDDRAYLGVGFRGLQRFFKTSHLKRVALIRCGIVEVDEIGAVLYPVVVGG